MADARHRFIFWIMMLCLLLVAGAESAWAEAEAVEPETFPGLNEVIPRANNIVSRLAEANATVEESYALKETRKPQAMLSARLNELEAQFTDWDDVDNWPLNRLMAAEARYTQIDLEQKMLFKGLSGNFSGLEDLRATWIEEKTFWQEWRGALTTAGTQIPAEVFTKTEQQIEALLQNIATASSQLIEKQTAFSAEQDILTNRLSQIDETLVQSRKAIFRRNAYSLFSPDFYQQLTPALFTEYRDNFLVTIKLPEGFWWRQGWIAALQLILVISIISMLMRRRRKTKPISNEWQSFFRHPIAGAIFVTLATTSSLYEFPPPVWEWLILTIATIAGTILVSEMVDIDRRRRLIITLAATYLISKALKMSGLPIPAYQVYEVLLCILAIPTCLLIARQRRLSTPEPFDLYLISLYVISLVALLGLGTALLGFASLSIHLIDAMLGTVVVMFIVRLTIQLADGAVDEFLQVAWVSQRQFIIRLGSSTGSRLKHLARLVIVVNALIYLLVVWGLYSDSDAVTTHLLGLKYEIGEFSISVYMVTMLVLVLYLVNLASWLLQAFADAHYMTRKDMDFGVKTALKRLLHYGLFCIGFFIAVSMAGLDLQKFAIIAGALGVGIGFGLQNIVNNFVSGLVLLFERPIKVGDTINIEDQWGTITSIGLRSTVFETLDHSEIIVPNSDLISQKVTNWTLTSSVSRVILEVSVAYGSPLEEVLEILIKVAEENPGILENPKPSAIFMAFGDSAIDFELRVWVNDIKNRLQIRSELGLAVDKYFREAQITIPFPQRDLHLHGTLPDAKPPALPDGIVEQTT